MTAMTSAPSNLQALDFDLPVEVFARLEGISRPEATTPYMFFGGTMQQMQTNGTRVTAPPEW